MRVLILTPDFPPAQGGIQVLMHRLAVNLPRAEARVITLESDPSRRDGDEGIDVVRIRRGRPKRHRLAVARLNLGSVRRAWRHPPDAIISGHLVTAPAGAMIQATRRVPLIQYLHADEIRHRPWLARFAMRRADRVIAVSRHTKEMALALGCDERKVRIVHPGVDPPRQRRGDRAHSPTILTVSRLADAYKGHDSLIRALPLIRSRVPDVRWAIVGEGPLRPELEDLARSHGILDATSFVGSISDAERDAWFERAHVFAMPSRLPAAGAGGEGFGISFLEAGAHGMPVVACSVGGALDAVVDGQTGRLVDPGDHVALAEAIIELLLDRRTAERLGEAGARRAAEFSWKRHAEVIGGLIEEVRRDHR